MVEENLGSPAKQESSPPEPATSETITIASSEKPAETAAAPTTTAPQTTTAAVEPPVKAEEPPAAKESEPQQDQEATSAQLRALRLQFINSAIEHATFGHAEVLAMSTMGATQQVREAEHRSMAQRELTTLGLSPEWVQLMLNLLANLRNIPVPTKEQLDGWSALASNVFDVFRQFFSHAKPVDQELNDVLHSLGDSIAAPQILGCLALRMHLQGWETLDEPRLNTIIDGHQVGELEKIQLKPMQIVPLVEGVLYARTVLERREQHLKLTGAPEASK